MKRAQAALRIVGMVCAACGGGGSPPPVDAPSDPVDATPGEPDAGRPPGLGPLVELELLPPRDPKAPFNHSWEPSIAANGDDVVVAYIHYSMAGADTFEEDANPDKRVGIAVSHDRGANFGAPIDPQTTALLYSTDPVVRVAPDGTFWFAMLGQSPGADVPLARSADGDAWEVVATVPSGDKEWFALDG